MAATATAVLVATLAPSAPAGAVVAWKHPDQTGDVKLEPGGGGGYTKAQRRSIDITWVRAVTVEGGATRFRVKIARVIPGLDGDQMVFLYARPLPGEGTYPLFSSGSSAQQPTQAYASLQTSDDEFGNCESMPTTSFNTRTDVISQVVPYECLPAGRFRLRVTTAVGTFQSDGAFSSDNLRFRTKLR